MSDRPRRARDALGKMREGRRRLANSGALPENFLRELTTLHDKEAMGDLIAILQDMTGSELLGFLAPVPTDKI